MRYVKFVALIFAGLLMAQNNPITGSMTFSSPEANLGFLTLDYVNPARASAVLGGFANPAAFGRISHLEFDAGLGFTNSSTMRTNVTLLDSSEYNDALVVPFDIETKDAGGIYGFGFGVKFAMFGAGFGIFKPYKFGVDINNNTTFPLNFHGQIIDTLLIQNRDSANLYSSVEMHWSVEGTVETRVRGIGGLSLEARPMFFGAGIGFGPLSLGAAFKITKYSGGGNPLIGAQSTAVVNMTGTSPDYAGSVNATVGFQHTISSVTIASNISGTRKAFAVGANLSLGILKIGGYFENGFKTTLSGDYIYIATQADFSSLCILDVDTANIYISGHTIHQDTTITGVINVAKDDITHERYSANLELPAYKAAGLGLSVGIVDAFISGSIPQKGNIHYANFGLFARPPLPHFKLRAGISISTQYYYTQNGKLVPLTVLPYVGAGASIPLNLGSIPFGPTLGLPVTLDISAKSNVLSLTGKIIEKMVDSPDFKIESTPNPLKTLSFGVGVRVEL